MSDAPHQRAPKRRKTAMYRNENMRREIHIMMVPHVKAMTTERSMADIIPIARVVLMNSPMSVSSSWGCVAILYTDTATAEPRRQNMSDTVVDVGRPIEL